MANDSDTGVMLAHLSNLAAVLKMPIEQVVHLGRKAPDILGMMAAQAKVKPPPAPKAQPVDVGGQLPEKKDSATSAAAAVAAGKVMGDAMANVLKGGEAEDALKPPPEPIQAQLDRMDRPNRFTSDRPYEAPPAEKPKDTSRVPVIGVTKGGGRPPPGVA